MILAGTLTPAPLSLRARTSRNAGELQHACSLLPGSSDTRQRYCASLGHRQDDETGTYTGGSPDGDGLVYMRARYYEPGTGRFVSEDPARDGANWYVYCSNQPAHRIDQSGKEDEIDGWTIAHAFALGAGLYLGHEFGHWLILILSRPVKGADDVAIAHHGMEAWERAESWRENLISNGLVHGIEEITALFAVAAVAGSKSVVGVLGTFGLGFTAGTLIGFYQGLTELCIAQLTTEGAMY